MTQETIVYENRRFERTYSPSIPFGLESSDWNKINKEFIIIK
jgi:hypothetical protein